MFVHENVPHQCLVKSEVNPDGWCPKPPLLPSRIPIVRHRPLCMLTRAICVCAYVCDRMCGWNDVINIPFYYQVHLGCWVGIQKAPVTTCFHLGQFQLLQRRRSPTTPALALALTETRPEFDCILKGCTKGWALLQPTQLRAQQPVRTVRQ